MLHVMYQFLEKNDPETLDLIKDLEPCEKAAKIETSEGEKGIQGLTEEVQKVKDTIEDINNATPEEEKEQDLFVLEMSKFVKRADELCEKLKTRLDQWLKDLEKACSQFGEKKDTEYQDFVKYFVDYRNDMLDAGERVRKDKEKKEREAKKQERKLARKDAVKASKKADKHQKAAKKKKGPLRRNMKMAKGGTATDAILRELGDPAAYVKMLKQNRKTKGRARQSIFSKDAKSIKKGQKAPSKRSAKKVFT